MEELIFNNNPKGNQEPEDLVTSLADFGNEKNEPETGETTDEVFIEDLKVLKEKHSVSPFSIKKPREQTGEYFENLYDEEGQIDYKKYFQTEEGENELKNLSAKAKTFFNEKGKDKDFISQEVSGLKEQLENKINKIINLEKNGDVYVIVNKKREKVFDNEKNQEKIFLVSNGKKIEVSSQDWLRTDLSHIENCEIPYLEDWKNKDGVMDFTGFQAENLTWEKIKMFKSFRGKCIFNDEARKKIDSFNEL